MIKLRKDNLVMEVGTEVQASAFLKAGYTVVNEEAVKVETSATTEEKPVARRGRKAANTDKE